MHQYNTNVFMINLSFNILFVNYSVILYVFKFITFRENTGK